MSSLINNNNGPNITEFESNQPEHTGIVSPNINQNMKPSRLKNQIGKVKPSGVLSGNGPILNKDDS